MKRVLYLAYYLKELDRKQFREFCRFVQNHPTVGGSRIGSERPRKSISTMALWKEIIVASLTYNISIFDYFYFRFYEQKDHHFRNSFAGTGFLYEYQLKMNPLRTRSILEDKIQFLRQYSTFVHRKHLSIDQLMERGDTVGILGNEAKKMVVKGSKGQVGAEVQVLATGQFDLPSLLTYMKKNKFDLIEEYVVQHPLIMALSPSGLNTVRIFTQLENQVCTVLGARLRISINSPVDNMAAGNIAAPIDLSTGRVSGPGVFSSICKEDVIFHPVTGVEIPGFQLPFWKETLEMIEKAAFSHPQNRSIGWDIAITAQGPELIEGNHNWCKLLWQLPVKKGLKNELLKFT